MSGDSSQPSVQRTLLIVDDQHSVRVSLAFLLQEAGYRVLTAESGRAALALADTETFDGVIMDVHMPTMNGFDSCIALQSKLAAQSRLFRIWFMTGVCTSDVERRAMNLGALGVFRKPFDWPFLFERLATGLTTTESPPPLPTLSCSIANEPSGQ